jgi:hypothetical protein
MDVNLRIKVVIHSTFLLCSVLNFSRFFHFTCLFLLNLRAYFILEIGYVNKQFLFIVISTI